MDIVLRALVVTLIVENTNSLSMSCCRNLLSKINVNVLNFSIY